GVGLCRRSIVGCENGRPVACTPGLPSPEVCNDLDDDCDGVVDEGCDEDGDGFCAADAVILGRPAVCVYPELDCDDESRLRNPGSPELCDDQIDNDCDDRIDVLDIQGCEHITTTIEDADGVVVVNHGESRELRAVLSPARLDIERRWSVIEATPETDCALDDLTLSEARELEDSSFRTARIVDLP
ncbi:MAG: hypothetical protein KC620_27345, partial [Myxococcales bacterium]|nr:hypothetical protein [Myxococcales bacterium]